MSLSTRPVIVGLIIYGNCCLLQWTKTWRRVGAASWEARCAVGPQWAHARLWVRPYCPPNIPVSPSHEVPCGTFGPSDGCPRAGGTGMARAGKAAWARPKRDCCCCWLSTGRSWGGLISRALNQCQSEQGRWGQHLLLSKGVGSQRRAASVSCRAWQPGPCGQLCPAEMWGFAWESIHWLWEESIACLCCVTP